MTNNKSGKYFIFQAGAVKESKVISKVATTNEKIIEINSSFHVKQCTTGKLNFYFSGVFSYY